MAGTYQLVTLGCKVNQYESQAVRELLERSGLRSAQPTECPDLAIVNTCAVTSEATRKSRQAVRRLVAGGRTKVVVMGCAATADPRRFSGIDGVVAVHGHDSDVLNELRELLVRERLAQPGEVLFPRPLSKQVDPCEDAPSRHRNDRNDHNMSPSQHNNETRSETSSHVSTKTIKSMARDLPLVKADYEFVTRIEHFAGHQRAFLKVQDGCDAFCTYCIIPRLRPRLRSKPVSIAVAEARALVASGHREIILTGIFLGAYGQDTALRRRQGDRSCPLAELVRAIAQIEGLARLRLSSLEPGDLSDELLSVLSTYPVCVPHLHLPLQSGSPDILRRMNRQYTLADYLRMLDRVNTVLDRPAISTDIIVGFPGETQEDFEATLSVARAARFIKIHAFPFSPREGTAAARWTRGFVPGSVVAERMAQLAAVEVECSLAYRQQFVGTTQRVLVEHYRHEGDDGDQEGLSGVNRGRSDRYFMVDFDGGDVSPGELVSVRIDRVTVRRTHGTLVACGRRHWSLPVMNVRAIDVHNVPHVPGNPRTKRSIRK